MLGAVSRYWRHLFRGNSRSDHQRIARIRDGGLEVLPPSSGFTPREGEVIHAEGVVHARDDSRDLDLGGGILLVTNRAIVFFTSRKKWRVPWRSIEQAVFRRSRTLQVKTSGGKSFAFKIPSTSEAEVISATLVVVMAATIE